MNLADVYFSNDISPPHPLPNLCPPLRDHHHPTWNSSKQTQQPSDAN